MTNEDTQIELRTGSGGFESAYIGRTRIRVSIIARQFDLNTPEESTRDILEGYPNLTAAQVKAAVTYWQQNKETIECEIQEEDALFEAHATVKS